MSLETLLAAAEYLEWRSSQESIGLSHQAKKDVPSFPSSPVKRGAPSSAYGAQSQQQLDARNDDSSESGERKRWAGTREVHNKLEKNRRAHLKECFEMLRQEIPSIEDRKISNLAILQKALRHVESVKSKGAELDEEKKRITAVISATQAKVARLKQEVKAMGMIDDVDAWLTSQLEADCSTSTASECGDEEECFEENAIKVGSRGPRKSWKTEASWPVTNGKVELKVLRVPPQPQPQQQPQQQPALQRMQHCAVRATLQQRIHMRVNPDTAAASMRSSPVDRANGLTGSSDSARHAAQSSVPPPPPPPLSFEPSGIHSSALVRAARAAGHPAAVRSSISAGSSGSSISNSSAGSVSISSFNSNNNNRPDCAATGGGTVAAITSQANHHVATSSHGVVLSSLPVQQQQQQHHQLFLLPTGTSTLVAAAAASAPLQSSVTALSLPPGAKRVLAPLQPVAVSAAGATMAQSIVGATGLVFPTQQFVPATAAAMFPYFLDALRSPLSLVPCHAAAAGRDQLLQQPQPHKPAAAVCSSGVGTPIGGGGIASASTPASEPTALRPTAVMPSSSSPFRPVVGHTAGTVVNLVPASAATAPAGGDGSATSGQQPAATSIAVRSAVAQASSGGAAALAGGGAAQLHIQTAQLPAAPSPLLAKQAPLHIVTAPQQYVLMMAAPAASQDAVPSTAAGAQASATFDPSASRSVAGELQGGSSSSSEPK